MHRYLCICMYLSEERWHDLHLLNLLACRFRLGSFQALLCLCFCTLLLHLSLSRTALQRPVLFFLYLFVAEAMDAHEYYCADYARKDQPNVDGLLISLADALKSKEDDIAAVREAGEVVRPHEHVRRNLDRFVSSTHRRTHKGFLEMFTYLLRKPLESSAYLGTP